MVCVLPIFFSFFHSPFCYLFLSVFALTDTNDLQDSRHIEGIIVLHVFHFDPLTNIHLVYQHFSHFFLIDLFVITRLIADETCSLLIFVFLCIDPIKSDILTFTFQSDIVRIWAHIKLSPFYYNATLHKK